MRAKINVEYRAAPEGHTVITYRVGEVVTGMVALWAISAGHAEELPDEDTLENKVETEVETKDEPRRRGRKPKAE